MFCGYSNQEAFAQEMGPATQGAWNSDNPPPFTPELIALSNAHWEKVAGWNKGRLYGTGPMAPLITPSGAGPSKAPTRRRAFPTQSDAERERFRKLEEELHATQQKLQEEQMQNQQWRQKMENDMKRVMEFFQSQGSMPQHTQQPEESDSEYRILGDADQESEETEESDDDGPF